MVPSRLLEQRNLKGWNWTWMAPPVLADFWTTKPAYLSRAHAWFGSSPSRFHACGAIMNSPFVRRVGKQGIHWRKAGCRLPNPVTRCDERRVVFQSPSPLHLAARCSLKPKRKFGTRWGQAIWQKQKRIKMLSDHRSGWQAECDMRSNWRLAI